jgi:hypothetical protein
MRKATTVTWICHEQTLMKLLSRVCVRAHPYYWVWIDTHACVSLRTMSLMVTVSVLVM